MAAILSGSPEEKTVGTMSEEIDEVTCFFQRWMVYLAKHGDVATDLVQFLEETMTRGNRRQVVMRPQIGMSPTETTERHLEPPSE